MRNTRSAEQETHGKTARREPTAKTPPKYQRTPSTILTASDTDGTDHHCDIPLDANNKRGTYCSTSEVGMRSIEQWAPRSVQNAEHRHWFLTALTDPETPCKNMMISTIGSPTAPSSLLGYEECGHQEEARLARRARPPQVGQNPENLDHGQQLHPELLNSVLRQSFEEHHVQHQLEHELLNPVQEENLEQHHKQPLMNSVPGENLDDLQLMSKV